MLRVAALLIVVMLLGLPALARAAVTSTTQLSPTAPPWLTGTSTRPAAPTTPAAATTTAPATSTSSAATTPASTAGRSGGLLPSASGNLPYTGDNLLPEAIVAGGLLVGGVALRLRLR